MSSNERIGFSDADSAELAEIVRAATATQAAIAAAQAENARILARAQKLAARQSLASRAAVKRSEMALRAVAAELACALRTSDRAVQRQISEALTLVDDFPATLEAWSEGVITRAHVHLIVELGLPLPPEVREEFEQLAIIRCEAETAGRLRSELAILAERLHPRTLTERHAEAREERCIRTFTVGGGMSGLTVIAPTLHVEAIADRLTQQAAALVDLRVQAAERVRARDAGSAVVRVDGPEADASLGSDRTLASDEVLASDTRTMEQLRVDIFTDLLLTGQPATDPTRTDDGPGALGAIRAKVQVVVPALTLLGADEHPADLVGRSPIDADTARRLAGGVTSWDRVLTHPVSGAVVATDSRFVTLQMRRFLNARDWHCRFPGCRVPAIRTEIDHTVDHAEGGPTSIDNSAGLCQRHHSGKQFTPWRVRQLGEGVLEWTSPLGKVYLDSPPVPSVHFVPDLVGGTDGGGEGGGGVCPLPTASADADREAHAAAPGAPPPF